METTTYHSNGSNKKNLKEYERIKALNFTMRSELLNINIKYGIFLYFNKILNTHTHKMNKFNRIEILQRSDLVIINTKINKDGTTANS